jgi:septum formation protein
MLLKKDKRKRPLILMQQIELIQFFPFSILYGQNRSMLKLILASQSPRRKKILSEAGFNYIDLPVNVSEIPDKNLNLDDQVLKIAEDKAKACIELNNHLKNQDFLVLSADTMVIVDNDPLGKPKNYNEACIFLRLLSGRSHEVKTALFLFNCRTLEHAKAIATTKVHFRELREDEILEYVQSGESMDKAGAYGIQGAAGKFVTRIEGAMDTVIGLPLETFTQLLERKNWHV